MKILYLFHDLMNLYGDNGNVRYLSYALEKITGEPVQVVTQSIGDPLSFEGVDFIYCGAGEESKRDLALTYLKPYTQQLKKAILEEKIPTLFTGCSWTMLGKSITDAKGSREGLGLFSYETKESHEKRTVQDAIYVDLLDGVKTAGFVNRFGEVTGVDSPLFRVEMGPSNVKGSDKEGYTTENFFATFLTGPILVKNPPFLHLILSRIKGLDQEKAAAFSDPDAAEGYEITIRELTKRMKEEGPEA